MKYKYIGTVQMLYGFGYVEVNDDIIKYIKRTNDYNVFIDKEYMVHTWNDNNIQDLIDANLVEVIK